MRKKKIEKEDNKIKEIKEKVDVLVTEVGDVLNITADENNPIGDGKEFKDGSDK